MVPLILSHNPDLELLDKKGNSVLLYAVKYGHLPEVKLLESNGANLHTQNNFEETVMHIAAKIDRKDMCGWFLDKGINPF